MSDLSPIRRVRLPQLLVTSPVSTGAMRGVIGLDGVKIMADEDLHKSRSFGG